MPRLLLGIICGLFFGTVDALLMLPLTFADKTAAIAGAFASRFAIGFVIGASDLRIPGWACGLVFGFLLSLPDAIITKSYVPILAGGIVGGTIIGFVVGRWGSKTSS
jgi:hypothetical protein